MIELRNEEQRKRYAHDTWVRLFGEESAELKDRFLDIGVLNYVYQITSGNRTIFLKQALKKAKHHEKIGKDLASMPIDRIKYEKKYIGIVKKFLPKEVEVPSVLNYDEENHVLILSDVKKGGVLLEASMLEGKFNEKPAYYLGNFLGISNKNTLGKKIVIRGNEKADLENWHLFLNMRTRGILQKGNFPNEVKKELERFYDDVKNKYTFDVLVNTDYCPKNVLERQDGTIGLVDFEQACGIGDTAFDLGFLMGHYLIIGILNKEKIEEAITAMNGILRGYNREMNYLKDNRHDERVIKYAGAVMLYRISGSSWVPWIKQEYAPLIKEIGIYLILNYFRNNFLDVFKYLREKLK